MVFLVEAIALELKRIESKRVITEINLVAMLKNTYVAVYLLLWFQCMPLIMAFLGIRVILAPYYLPHEVDPDEPSIYQ